MSAETVRLPAPPGRRASDWPALIRQLLAAGVDGPQALAEAGVAVARRITAADGATLVRWTDGRAGVVACCGDAVERFDRRPPEGAGRLAWRPLAVVSVDSRTDLVVTREKGLGFGDHDVEALGAVAALLGRGGAGPPDAVALVRGLAVRVVASPDVDEVLVAVADATSRLLRAEIAGVLLVDGAELTMRCAVGNRTAETAHLRVRRGQGLAGRVLATGRAERVDDYATDTRIGAELLAVAEAEGTCSAACAPLVRDRRTVGVLCAWRRRRVPFTDDAEALLVALADLATAALDAATRREAERSETDRLREAHQAMEDRCRVAERDLGIHVELNRIAVEGDDLVAVLRALRAITGGAAAALDDDGRVLAACERAREERLPARVAEAGVLRGAGVGGDPADGAADGSSRVVELEGGRSWLVLAPLRAAGAGFGSLCLDLAAPPTRDDRVAAEQAAVVGGLLLARQEAAVSATRRLQSEFVWDLLEGRLPDESEALVRARHLGAGFRLPARVVLVEAAEVGRRAAAEGWSPEHLDRTRARIRRALLDRLDEGGARDAVVARRGDLFALVVPAEGTVERARRLAARLAPGPRLSGIGWTVGVGGLVDAVPGFPEGWRQARLALSAAPAPGVPGVFDDLGVLQFLLAPGSRADLDRFAQRLLGPLVAYDRDHGTELVGTLRTYVAVDCSTRRAAERLCVHHKTVAYRLQRVEELTSLRLDRQEDRFHAQLALKILGLADGAARVDDGVAQPPVGTNASK